MNNIGLTTNMSEILSGIELPGGPSHGEKYDIISRVAYLIGVPKRIFDNEHEPPKIEIYEMLEKEKKARIIRNLCTLRTQLERNFRKVCQAIQHEKRSIMGMPELMSTEAMQALYDDGIDIYKNIREPSPFLIGLNQEIRNRLYNCREFFPDKLNWDYLSDIFNMPGGTTEEGTKKAAAVYYENLRFYPYQQYINWRTEEDDGNILHNDKKFVTLLYSRHNDEFREMSLVSDVSSRTKANIHTFIEKSEKCVFIVDCENSDPYNLCAAIRNLDPERLSKIDKIILFDDVHAASAWELLETFIDIPIQYIMIKRLKDNKSLADIKVAVRTCEEHFTNDVDSFVIVSSDSDYWGMIEELPKAKFLLMIEHEKSSAALKQTLLDNDIFYCYIDDFYSGGGDDIKNAAIEREISRSLKASLELNLNSMMREVLERTRIKMTEDEMRKFVKKKVRNNLRIEISEEGDVELEYRLKR